MSEKRDPHGALAVLPVGVHQHDRLPGTQCHDPVQNWNDGTGRHKRGNNVISAMTTTAVAVKPARVAGEQLVDVPEQVPVRTCSGLNERYPRRAVRDEYRHEPVALPPHKGRHPLGDVERPGCPTRPDPKGVRVHPR